MGRFSVIVLSHQRTYVGSGHKIGPWKRLISEHSQKGRYLPNHRVVQPRRRPNH